MAGVKLSDDMQLSFSVFGTLQSGTTTVADNFRISLRLNVPEVVSDNVSSFVVQDVMLKVQLVVE